MDKLFETLVANGGAWGILVAGMAVALRVLWKRNVLLGDKVYDLSMAQVQVQTELRVLTQKMSDDLEEIRRIKGR